VIAASTTRRLERLLARRRRLEAAHFAALDRLAVAALQASENGATRVAVARELGVGVSTVQGWVARGRVIRAENDEGQRGPSLYRGEA
jgi:transposase-like protein